MGGAGMVAWLSSTGGSDGGGFSLEEWGGEEKEPAIGMLDVLLACICFKA